MISLQMDAPRPVIRLSDHNTKTYSFISSGNDHKSFSKTSEAVKFIIETRHKKQIMRVIQHILQSRFDWRKDLNINARTAPDLDRGYASNDSEVGS